MVKLDKESSFFQFLVNSEQKIHAEIYAQIILRQTKEIKSLKRKNLELEEHIKYMPGSYGYEEAKYSFENSKKRKLC